MILWNKTGGGRRIAVGEAPSPDDRIAAPLPFLLSTAGGSGENEALTEQLDRFCKPKTFAIEQNCQETAKMNPACRHKPLVNRSSATSCPRTVRTRARTFCRAKAFGLYCKAIDRNDLRS